jgi:hypothetical protein
VRLNCSTKNNKPLWLPKTGLLKLHSQDLKTMCRKLYCSQMERFYNKKFNIKEKMHVAILSKDDYHYSALKNALYFCFYVHIMRVKISIE